MARNVNFDLNHPLMEAGLESPVDEEGVHDSFSQLIAEQSQNRGPSDAFELQQLQRQLDEEDRDNVAYLSSPGREFRGRRQGQRDNEWEDDETQTDPLMGERWSSATMRILSSMPSRTIGRNRGAIISQYYNRTMQLRRRRQSRPAIRDFAHSARPSIRGYGMEVDSTDAEASKRDRLVNNLQNLSVSDRVRMLRAMPLNVAEKSELRRLALQKEKRTFSGSQIPCCSQLKYYIIIGVRQSWYSWLSFLHSLQLWQVALKRVSGRFGTGVLSYFLFLKTLLFFNLFLFLVTGAFMVLPQAVHPPVLPAGISSFTGLELLTGAGYFSDSVMYYGYYSNDTLRKSCADDGEVQNVSLSNGTRLDCGSKHLSYNMPLAYFFTIGVAFFVTCIILVYSMSKSFGQSFRIDKSHSILAIKVLCSWDFKVIKKTSVKLMSENICTQLKELLAEVNHKQVNKTRCQRLWRLMVHGLAWSICIASTTACVLAIYYFSDHMYQNLKHLRSVVLRKTPVLNEASLLALPVLVSLINLLLPGLFNLTAWMEDYESPSVRTYVSIGRNLMLKVSVLGVLCYHWLGRVAADPKIIGLKCWESFVGQELYRFLLMDFIFTLLDTLFGEFLWRLFSEKALKRRRKPVFDIARNVLELIYGQTLAWLGVLFTPLLPAVQILKLLLLFYIKKSSVMMNCQAPRKPYRVSQMTTVFITLLCFPSFLGASVCVTYTMWSITPSSSCGPFRGLKTMFQAGKRWVEKMEKDNPNLSVLARAHSYLVENPLFLFVGAGIFLIVIYFHSQVVDGQRKIIGLLQEQIENEGEDKKFLITRLQKIHEQKRTPARRLVSQNSNC
ncbi:transmembrane channel-like protein 6b isoform X1 [Cottoperca gobio]|uniref:Transmembrane channel-like protein n=1 Tax=Cottoperca gobio TaxID=56716 RepID=A0A6J2PQG5_COTGO|nr:transmembrane channel-like protein 6 isoform X1 [Cottoperca gobio]XP_029287562.1 transmembrane channel-like protein 6 isoform X1 [Cottoperca gobio]XP_029287571.1 transmembrane channel-like protein 6 isoform X1 [Cottoperca gobio]